jgi:nucleoside-diphosphate-sugar epimerase
MKVFVAGATGAIGRRLVPKLLQKGHAVHGTVRSAEGAAWLRAQGATPVPLDLLEPAAVKDAVRASRPDAIIHEGTALSGAGARSFSNPDRTMRGTNQLRTRGTDALLAAARDAGVPRFIAQSYTGWPNARTGGAVKTEDDPLDPHPLPKTRRSLAAIQYLERRVLEVGGLALRYGWLYGGLDDPMVKIVRRRLFPLIGEGSGVWSFIHFEDAAEATALALERGASGVYNVVDDDPAPARVWLPTLAAMIGAPPPRHLPRVVARVLAGDAPVMLMTDARGASNAKAKRELGWKLRFRSWRVGFLASYVGDVDERSGRFVWPDIGGAHV